MHEPRPLFRMLFVALYVAVLYPYAFPCTIPLPLRRGSSTPAVCIPMYCLYDPCMTAIPYRVRERRACAVSTVLLVCVSCRAIVPCSMIPECSR